MDIFEYADSIGWSADYYDMRTGYIYHIQEASCSSKNRIRVSSGNVTIGYVNKE